jgi:hypothetical protein
MQNILMNKCPQNIQHLQRILFMIDDAGKFTKKRMEKYLDNIAGYLSYF